MKSKGELSMNSSKHQPPMVEAVSTLSVKELMASQEDDRRSEYSMEQSTTPPPAYSRGNGVTATTKLIMATVIIVSVILGACIVAASWAARQSHCQCPHVSASALKSSPFPTDATSRKSTDDDDEIDAAIAAAAVQEANAFAAFAEKFSASAPNGQVVANTEDKANAEEQQAGSPNAEIGAASTNKEAGNAPEASDQTKVDGESKTGIDTADSKVAPVEEQTEEKEGSDGNGKKKNRRKNKKGGKKNKRKNKNKRRNRNKARDEDEDEDDGENSPLMNGAAINTMGPVIFHLDDLARTILEHEEKAVVSCILEKRNDRPPSMLLPFLVDSNQQQTLKVFCRGGQDQPFGPMVAISATKEGISPTPNNPMGLQERLPFMMSYPGAPLNPNHVLASAMFSMPPPHAFLRESMGPRRINRKMTIFPRILDLLPPFSAQSAPDRPHHAHQGPQLRIVKKLPSEIEEAVMNVIEPLDMLFNEEAGPKAHMMAGMRRPMVGVPEPKLRVITEAVEDMPTPFEVESSLPAGPSPAEQQELQNRPSPQPSQPQTESQFIRRPFSPAPARFPFNILNGRRPHFLAGLFPPAPPRPIDQEATAQEQPETRQQDGEEENEDGENGHEHPGMMMGPNFHFNHPQYPMGGPRGVPLRERFMMHHEALRRQMGKGGPNGERPDRFGAPDNDEDENDGETNSEHEEHEVAFHQMRRGGPMRFNNQQGNDNEEEEFEPFVSPISEIMQPPPAPRHFRTEQQQEEDEWSEPTGSEHQAHPVPHFMQPRSVRNEEERGPVHHPF